MKILSNWLRSYLADLDVSDRQLADDLTLRGIAVEGVFDLGGNGSLFEMDITTNRVDAMNHYGIAREAATLYGVVLKPLVRRAAAAQKQTGSAPAFPVRIEDPERCGRFTARVLRGVSVRPSNGLVAERFALLGQKQISNAVDATNYITLAMGHPTHVFDLDTLEGSIVVRRARAGEKLRTLDGIERTLDADDLVVADESKALALAGVMGGWDSRVTESTRNILVEAAWFDPGSTRRSSRRHLLHTDASHRFERGADIDAAQVASELVAALILEAGGAQAGEMVDVLVPGIYARTADRPTVPLSLGEVRRILGATEDPAGIDAAQVKSILAGLGCALTPVGHAAYHVRLPSWRLDLEREVDLVEEVARVYGYNRFQNTLPAFKGSVEPLPWAAKENALRRTLLATGYSEAVSNTFCSRQDAEVFAQQPGSFVAMENPLSEEAGMLRSSLMPGMLTMIANNLHRGVEEVALFEIGTVFGGSAERVEERPALSLGLTGGGADFYQLKGAVEQTLARFETRLIYFDRFPVETGLMPVWLHPGRGARAVVDGETIAWFGQLHPDEAQRRKLKQPAFLAELWLDRLYRHPLHLPMARELSRFQPVRRDFSLVFPGAVPYARVAEALRALNLPELHRFELKEVLADKEGELYSLLLGTVLQSQERTLKEDELRELSQTIVAALEAVGGRLRG